jgi:hypothetical protein
MTQAAVHVFTLAECMQYQHVERFNPVIRNAMREAVDCVGSSPLSCMLCTEPLNGTPSYLALVLPQAEAGECWVPSYGGVCVECGTRLDRGTVTRRAEGHAHFCFGEPVGRA